MLAGIPQMGDRRRTCKEQIGHEQNKGSPLSEIIIRIMELVAAVNSVRLAQRLRESLKVPIDMVRYFTDSSAVLGMLKQSQGDSVSSLGRSVSRSTSMWVMNGTG